MGINTYLLVFTLFMLTVVMSLVWEWIQEARYLYSKLEDTDKKLDLLLKERKDVTD
jgi:hypothetical protein